MRIKAGRLREPRCFRESSKIQSMFRKCWIKMHEHTHPNVGITHVVVTCRNLFPCTTAERSGGLQKIRAAVWERCLSRRRLAGGPRPLSLVLAEVSMPGLGRSDAKPACVFILAAGKIKKRRKESRFLSPSLPTSRAILVAHYYYYCRGYCTDLRKVVKKVVCTHVFIYYVAENLNCNNR